MTVKLQLTGITVQNLRSRSIDTKLSRLMVPLSVTACHAIGRQQTCQYLMDFCHPTSSVASRQQLRSAIVVPRCRLSTTARRAFSVVGPSVWNSLPGYLRDCLVLAETHSDNIWKRICSLCTSAYSTLEVLRLWAI